MGKDALTLTKGRSVGMCALKMTFYFFISIGLTIACSSCASTDGRTDKIKAAIDWLQYAPLGPSSLATPRPAYSADVRFLVSEGRRSVPFLVAAMERTDNPVLLGYSA
jgi:hypothetical protein